MIRGLDCSELVAAGWRAVRVRAAMEAESQDKDRSSYSLGRLQVTLWLACRWGDSDAESPSSTADASTVSGWPMIEYTASSSLSQLIYYDRVKRSRLVMTGDGVVDCWIVSWLVERLV